MQLVVIIGQRVPALVIASIYVAWVARSLRSITPLVFLALAAVGFVLSVVSVKYLTGRVGPKFTDTAHTVWDGGNIFPSGHVAGAVTLYGVAAMVTAKVYRRAAIRVAVAISTIVGLGTVALNTHWLSDVVGAWMNGILVLLVAWALTPAVEHHLLERWSRLRRWHHSYAASSETLPFDTSALRRIS